MSAGQNKTLQKRLNGPNVRPDVITRLESFALGNRGLLLLESIPNSGASTLLLHFAEGLFLRADAPFPVYFSLRHGESSVLAAKRFAYEFMAQAIAFRRSDPTFSKTSPVLSEILRSAPATDVSWIRQTAEKTADESAFGPTMIERCLTVPILAASAGLRPLLIFDDLHLSGEIDGSNEFVQGIFRIAERSELPVIAAGRRRYISRFEGERFSLSSSSFGSVRDGVRRSAEGADLTLDAASLDLVAIQIGNRPGFISSLLKRVKQFDGTLSGFPLIERAYIEEIITGAIRRWFEREVGHACKDDLEAIKIKGLFGDLGIQNNPGASIASLSYSTGLSEERLLDISNRLYQSEIVEFSGGELRAPDGDPLMTDVLEAHRRTFNKKEAHSAVFTTMLASAVTRAPRLLSEHYRNGSALGLRGLIEKFGRRSVPKALFDQGLFNLKYKGRPKEEVVAELARDADSVVLPSVIFAGSLDSISSAIETFLESERAAFGLGFKKGTYDRSDETYWIAAEIDSKLAANKELAVEWCDRLEEIAADSGFENFQIWLVAPDGFDDEAAEYLATKSAFGSSAVQVRMLEEFLSDKAENADAPKAEYEIVIPMGEETEMIAAHTLEEIAKRYGLKAHDINQMKTALVEACINAAEHSHSPDARIRLQFFVGSSALAVRVSNRGVRLADAPTRTAETGRRGWGLKLMEKLMDEVMIEQTDDGTAITMTKFIDPAAKNAAAG